MSARKKINKHKELMGLLYIALIVLVILLTILNLQNIQVPRKVLGTSTEINYQEMIDEKKFWEKFLAKNPTYYDGWERISQIELLLGDIKSSITFLEIAKRIDSNR